MTFVNVDIHEHTHTCPANSEPHTCDRQRIIVAIISGGPCRNPITVRSGDTAATIACGRHLPVDEQCPACRTTVIERTITTTHLGYHGPQHPHTTGTAAQ